MLRTWAKTKKKRLIEVQREEKDTDRDELYLIDHAGVVIFEGRSGEHKSIRIINFCRF